MNKDFIKLVLAGKKKLLKMSALTRINVPVYDELSVKRLYADAMKLPNLLDYFPNEYAKGR